MIFLLLCVTAGLVSSQRPKETPDLWAEIRNDSETRITRLDVTTKKYNCHATCQFSIHKELVDYETAKAKCANSTWIGFYTPGGRKLLSIHSELENRLATYLFQHAYGTELENPRYEDPTNWAWIGLEKENNTMSRPDNAGKLVWNANDWRWVDGQKLDSSSYANWMTKGEAQVQPDMWQVEDDRQTAARIYRKIRKNHDESGVWDDTFKDKLHPYICKFNVPVHYLIFPEGKTWHEAKADCEARGFYFAKIRNKAENDIFVENAKLVFEEDRHERKFHHQNWIWIGATDLKSQGTFAFYDDEPIKFTIPWAKKQHDNKTTKKQGSQDYAAVSRWGEWDDSYGLDWKRPYACQCNPKGIKMDLEMERINKEWEGLAAKKQKEKEDAEAAKKAIKEERKKKKEERQKVKEERQRKKEERQRKKEENQRKKEEQKEANSKKKEERQRNKEERQRKKEEAQQKNKEEKERKKAEKEAKKEASKAAKAARKAAKAAAKAARKALRGGMELVEKRQWPSRVGGAGRRGKRSIEAEKRQWPSYNGRLRGKREIDVEKRQWANYGAQRKAERNLEAEEEDPDIVPPFIPGQQ